MIKCFLRDAAALLPVSIEQKGKPRVFRGDQWLIGRRLMQTHCGKIEIGEIIVCAINCKQAIERLTAAKGIVRDALRRFKQLMETGEIPTTAGQPAGGGRSPLARRLERDQTPNAFTSEGTPE